MIGCLTETTTCEVAKPLVLVIVSNKDRNNHFYTTNHSQDKHLTFKTLQPYKITIAASMEKIDPYSTNLPELRDLTPLVIWIEI